MSKGKIPDYDNPNHMITGILSFNEKKCDCCGTCATICPARSIKVPPKVKGEDRGVPHVEEIAPGVTLCMACGDCSAACPNGAITIKRGFRVKYPYYYHKLTQSTKFTFPKKY